MPKFRRKPVIIEAVRIKKEMTIDTREGIKKGNPGDWLITGLDGEQYPCEDEYFRKAYEPADDDAEVMFRVVISDDDEGDAASGE